MKTNKIITAHEIAKENRARMINMGVIVLSAIIRLWYILITDVVVALLLCNGRRQVRHDPTIAAECRHTC